jgi:2'-5' RNA ligase
MREANGVSGADFSNLEELERFRNIKWLRNHWSQPVGQRAYYWYLTFENNPGLHSIAKQCQNAISFPYYDLTPPDGLHLTLDRIAYFGDVAPDRLRAIEHAAIRSCEQIPPFDIIVGSLGGTPGAIGFTASPAQPIRELRDTFRAATLSICPDAPVRRSKFHPHVAIAYANSDNVPAAEVISAVEKLHAVAHISVTITEGTLVLLERRPRSYAWQAVSRIPLAG